jgi:hypothetical protein
MVATYGEVTERPIGLPEEDDDREEDKREEGPTPSALSLPLSVISPQAGTAIGVRGVCVGPLVQLLSHYCSDLCSDQSLVLQSLALTETCARHRQYQHRAASRGE